MGSLDRGRWKMSMLANEHIAIGDVDREGAGWSLRCNLRGHPDVKCVLIIRQHVPAPPESGFTR
jgi:hypothetical protein